MADTTQEPDNQQQVAEQTHLEGGTYEIIRNRLLGHGKELQARLAELNQARQDVFGSIETILKTTERVSTDNNCIPRDIAQVKGGFLFGYNVTLGLKTETQIKDVFSEYALADGELREVELNLLDDPQFKVDFQNLYKFYRETRFVKFARRGPNLYMVFRTGKSLADTKTFKWAILDGGLKYLDNRSDHEYTWPSQHQFEWKRAHRDMHRGGLHPHISLDDICFVESVGGDITIKIEDNTASGEGLYAEPVENPDQTLDDAEVFYSVLGHIVLIKIRPYQEDAFRYFVYNDKIQRVNRIDSIEHTCVLLPENHGFIFANGYYLADGETKIFDSAPGAMLFERRVDAQNGEDFLYVFYNREYGGYVLLQYNMIRQQVDPPIVCSGYTAFENGEVFLFKAEVEPQKHHAIQIWQTPFTGPNFVPEVRTDCYLYKLGNKAVVRCMAECQGVVNLLNKEETYANLYSDIARQAASVVDNYFWLNTDDAYHLDAPLIEIKTAADAAVEEFAKVTRLKSNTRKEINRVSAMVQELIRSMDHEVLREIGQFVSLLTGLRGARGEIIATKDLRYTNIEAVEALETDVTEHTEVLSQKCVEFLLRQDAMDPYRAQVSEVDKRIRKLNKGSDAKAAAQQIDACASELEMLIEIVSNLKIDDPTQTTQIIDGISDIYTEVNQLKAALKNRQMELLKTEGVAEFNAQLKLLNQSVVSYLEICDTPEKCDEYANRVMVQIESLESRFADFDEYVVELTDKREELYSAFESRKVQLLEKRSRRANTLATASDRILKGVQHRANALKSVAEINGYFASDLMIEKLRDQIAELSLLGESVKTDDILTRIKTIQEDAVRQLKDRADLFEDGENIIRIGSHKFSVNKQALELSTVHRDGELFFHLNGTGFFAAVEDEVLTSVHAVWEQEVLSENGDVYRAEYLAYQLMLAWRDDSGIWDPTLAKLDDAGWQGKVQAFAAPRYAEGYTKGVHDHDAALILHALKTFDEKLGLLRFSVPSRALGLYFWHVQADEAFEARMLANIRSTHRIRKAFGGAIPPAEVLAELEQAISTFAEPFTCFNLRHATDAARYLFEELGEETRHVMSARASDINRKYDETMKRKRFSEPLEKILDPVRSSPVDLYRIVREWLDGFVREHGEAGDAAYVDEAVVIYLRDDFQHRLTIEQEATVTVAELKGNHPRIDANRLILNYQDYMDRLRQFSSEVVPMYETFVQRSRELTATFTKELKLEEFKPRILSSFVRNRLLDEIYLPLIGNNLAKQIGAAGDSKRTDRMGMLLLISPPGYGKTTLMEYIANRLGLTFVKVNGPALGHDVTSLDPSEARNASAREELKKLNLAFEMGDNIMLYLDDIQHTHPELLQKFISLCDGQRKIEGVYKGVSRTYDLRGKKVAVVMAGNPYTESGDKFQIPDMLANRADTYNLGDIIGDNDEAFKLSYIENMLTSNPVLNALSRQSRSDIYAMVKIAETGSRDGVEFEGNYSGDEIEEYTNTLTKLLRVRDVILKVNELYISSAGMEEAYRVEPSFKLQGSYRNMNRIAERVLPVMNDEELNSLVLSSYEQDSQTLTTGAEANMLKFKELIGWLSPEEALRWDEIKGKFRKNQSMFGIEAGDKIGMVIAQMASFADGLENIRAALVTGSLSEQKDAAGLSPEMLQQIQVILESLRSGKEQEEVQHEVATRLPDAISAMMENQFQSMQTWLDPVLATSKQNTDYMRGLIGNFNVMVDGYNDVLRQLKEVYFPEIDPKMKKADPSTDSDVLSTPPKN
ncbi:MAG: MoxR-like ATPase [Kiritimatiellia bacterium]|jgi:MoxR-like ATPase